MNQKEGGVNMYNILKILFYADCYHLNKYMRPVTGDKYIAMPHGTVPELAYGILGRDELLMCNLELEVFPFRHLGKHFYAGTREYNSRYLSESDIEALQKGYSEYADLSFGVVKKKNHEHKAYTKAMREGNKYIMFEDLIYDEEVIEDLRENSQYVVV